VPSSAGGGVGVVGGTGGVVGGTEGVVGGGVAAGVVVGGVTGGDVWTGGDASADGCDCAGGAAGLDGGGVGTGVGVGVAGGVCGAGGFGGFGGGFGGEAGAGAAAGLGSRAGATGGGELSRLATTTVRPRWRVLPTWRTAALPRVRVRPGAGGSGYVGTGFRRTIAGGPCRERSPGSRRGGGWTGVGKTIVGDGLRADDHSSPVTTKQPVARATASNRTRRTLTSSSGRRTDSSATRRAGWAIVDSNHGPPPYQSGALTN
jgi:hypothetical protein